MTVFHKPIFYLFYFISNMSSVILHSQSRNCFILIKSFFYATKSKSVVTYMTLIITNISNNIIKQYYGIIKAFKLLVIVKKKQFSRTNILIQDRSIMLNKQSFFDLSNIFMMPLYQDGKLVKGWDVIRNQEMVRFP